MNKNENFLLIDIIKAILDNADEAKKEKEKNNSDYNNGRLLAYNEVLSIIKTYTIGEEIKELDFDIDKKYL